MGNLRNQKPKSLKLKSQKAQVAKERAKEKERAKARAKERAKARAKEKEMELIMVPLVHQGGMHMEPSAISLLKVNFHSLLPRLPLKTCKERWPLLRVRPFSTG